MERSGIWNPSGMPSTSGGNVYNDCWGYTTSTGEEYAIIGNVDSILVIDVTDCSNPQRVFGYYGGNRTVWRDFKVYGDYMYAVCDVNCSEGLHIFDMSALPGGDVTHVLSTTDEFTKAHNIYVDVDSSRLYACGVGGATDVYVYDLSSTPEDPELLASVDFNSVTGTGDNYYIHDLYVRNDTAYASHGYLGYYVWDMRDLSSIELLGSIDTEDYNHSSWPADDGQHAFFAEEVPTGLPMGVIDMENIHNSSTSLEEVHDFQDRLGTSGQPTPHNPYVKNDTLYISYYEDGIKAYEVSDPLNPVLIGYYDTYTDNGNSYTGYEGCWGIYPFFESGCIIASDISHGLNTIEFNFEEPCDSITAHYTGLVPDLNHLVEETATIDGLVEDDRRVTITAEESVEMQVDFEAEAMSKFEAKIGPCNDSNTLTPPTENPGSSKKN